VEHGLYILNGIVTLNFRIVMIDYPRFSLRFTSEISGREKLTTHTNVPELVIMRRFFHSINSFKRTEELVDEMEQAFPLLSHG
jgi:hypothetical protein